VRLQRAEIEEMEDTLTKRAHRLEFKEAELAAAKEAAQRACLRADQAEAGLSSGKRKGEEMMHELKEAARLVAEVGQVWRAMGSLLEGQQLKARELGSTAEQFRAQVI
jgi:hypothetical protein